MDGWRLRLLLICQPAAELAFLRSPCGVSYPLLPGYCLRGKMHFAGSREVGSGQACHGVFPVRPKGFSGKKAKRISAPGSKLGMEHLRTSETPFCTSCGAPMEGAKRFCGRCGLAADGLTVAGRGTGGSTAPVALDEEVRRLLRAGNKLGAVMLVRRSTGLNLEDAVARVDAIIAAMPAGSLPPLTKGKFPTVGCTMVLLAIGGVVAAVLFASGLVVAQSGAYPQALLQARASPAVIEALGQPIEASPWIWLNKLTFGPDGWKLRASVSLSGPKGQGELRLSASTEHGYGDPGWNVSPTFKGTCKGKPCKFGIP